MDGSIIRGDSGIKSYVLDFLFPNRCPFCGGFIPYNVLCCEECFSEILWADEHICPKCGKPKRPDCLCKESPEYSLCASAAYYSGIAKEGIYSLKFKNNLNAAAIFGRALRDKLSEMEVIHSIDLAVPVPMSPKQKRIRGYNQAEELAKHLTEGTDIPVRTDIIQRRFSKTAQHTLSEEDRKREAERIYFTDLHGTPLSDMTVLLIDDVLTTGSTLNACSGLLLRLGAERVICAAAATV
ncbi:ComF family protein [Huintestinicola sp.]|uniref:ComF family protein n=1 Tax=Huintestinicola sp. TaxID=2981661 RepID=UPI003D7EE93F